MSAHEIIQGSCGHTLAQCRCIGHGPGPKPVRTVPRMCYACAQALVEKHTLAEPTPPLDASVE